jgi:hypothetical protein
MNDKRGILDYAGRCVFFSLAIVTIGCAENTEVRDSAGADPAAQREQMSSNQNGTGTSATAEDARFMAVEEQGVKLWKASGPGRVDNTNNTITINETARGTKPLRLKVINNFNAEHGFAIDTMNVKEVLKPGEERIISAPLENIDPSATRHRVYCQLHEKHVPATLIINKDRSSTAESGTMDSGTPGQRPSEAGRSSQPRQDTGEASSTISGESEGQRMIREQSQRQREIDSTSRTDKAPGSIDSKACEGFPGFDRGCPGGPK